MQLTPAARSFRGFTEGLLHLLYPPSCAACGTGIEGSASLLCGPCAQAVADPPDLQSCWRCASTLGPHAGTKQGCDICTGERFAFERAIRLGAYEGALRTACLQLKGVTGYHLGHALASLLVDRQHAVLTAAALNLVTSVPLHWTRRLRRGYDHSDHLAQGVAHRLALPFLPRMIYRTRWTAHQSSVPFSERRANVRGAFRARSPANLQGKHVLLVDDILTSGATCHYAAKALKEGGAATVLVAVLARGRSKSRS